jgi:hypothetical protein
MNPPPETCDDPLAMALADGSCPRPGIPVDGCLPGFEHDGEYGCQPVLPDEDCPPGMMAVPGEATCHAVMECGEGTWGDVPVGPTTEHVDAAYTGGDSDGSATKPWTTIGDAVIAAAPDAVVAIAAGTYPESVLVSGKPLHFHGVCPAQVTIDAPSVGAMPCPPTAICIIGPLAGGSSVTGVSLTGEGIGLLSVGALDVLVDRVYVHDNADRGIGVQIDVFDASSLLLRDSLVEGNAGSGVAAIEGTATIERTVVRDQDPYADGYYGRGITVQSPCAETGPGMPCVPGPRASGTVIGSLIEGNREFGVQVDGADFVLEGSVIRDTLPQTADLGFGRGVGIQSSCRGVWDGSCDVAARSSAVIRGSSISDNHQLGAYVSGSDVTIENTVVAGTRPDASDMRKGRGLQIQGECVVHEGALVCDPNGRGTATVRQSLIADNHELGVFIGGAEASLERIVVRNTLPQLASQIGGRGINLQANCGGGEVVLCETAPSQATILASLVSDNHDTGIFVAASNATITGSVVRRTLAEPGTNTFGDGIAIVSPAAGPGSARVSNVQIDDSARAGLVSFGAQVAMENTRIRCSDFALSGESINGYDVTVQDLGGNLCGCPEADGPCKLVSAGLEPPEAVGAGD